MVCAGGHVQVPCFCSQHLVFAPGSSEVTVGFFGLSFFWSRICPSCSCIEFFLVPHHFFAFFLLEERCCPGACPAAKGPSLSRLLCAPTPNSVVGSCEPRCGLFSCRFQGFISLMSSNSQHGTSSLFVSSFPGTQPFQVSHCVFSHCRKQPRFCFQVSLDFLP